MGFTTTSESFLQEKKIVKRKTNKQTNFFKKVGFGILEEQELI
jgi:hypothetical protein